jgi:RNA-directed DNA polymerase
MSFSSSQGQAQLSQSGWFWVTNDSMDIADFFPSLSGARVRALLRTAGYPDTAATTLSRPACHATPQTVLTQTEYPLSSSTRERLLQQHLPQGAPTSAALSNLLLHRLDTRLTGFARSIGAHYTRYADDLAFSGNTSVNRIAEGLIPQITAIANSEGLTINHRKMK